MTHPTFGLGWVVNVLVAPALAPAPCNTRPARLSPRARDLFAKFFDIFETAVDRGKTDIGDFIELFQLLHHQIANHLARHFALTGGAQLRFNMIDCHFDVIGTHRTFFQRPQHSAAQFLFIKRFTHVVAFTTRGITSSATSKVVKRSLHTRHCRRRRTDEPSPTRRESITLVSTAKQNGQCIRRPDRG